VTLSSGTRLGPYEILSPLGAGGMGEVYRARDTRLSREVAIKVLPAELASDTVRLKRFEKEARSASSLNHPNIVTIYDIGSEGGVSWIAMEKVDGATVRELLIGGAMPSRKLLPIAVQIAEGLAKAHEAGIVHRDLKPENVMVTRDGLVKILDFGLAKLTSPMSGSGEESQLPTMTGTTPGVVVGTVGYMSPEQASGMQLDFRSDQFSLGSILYEMATGKRAFQRKTAIDTLAAILNEEPEPIAAINPQVPVPLRWITERCHAKEPRQRYASTEDLARDLASVRDHLSEVSGSTLEAAAPRTRPRLVAWGLALALAAAAIGALLAGRELGRTPLPRFQQLTFRRGQVGYARFAPDGQTVVYSAAWDGEFPDEIFTTRPGSLESRPLGIHGNILSVSSGGEMALCLMPGRTLAQAPLAGGAPRELVKKVEWAEWAPDGKSLAIIRRVEGMYRLELPIGKVLYETVNEINNLHVSPEGNRIAFHEVFGQSRHIAGEVVLLDTATKERKSTGINSTEFGWGPRGQLWFLSEGSVLRAVSPDGGRARVIAAFPGFFQLDDIARDGRLLIEHIDWRGEILGLAPGEARERSLSWLDSSYAAGLSDDGKTLLINELFHDAIYLRKTDGSPAVPLGHGKALALSPDGQRVLALRVGPPSELVLLPAGAGETKVLKTTGFESFVGGSFLPDGNRILFGGTENGHRPRLYVMDIGEGNARPVSPEGVELGERPLNWVSPDGKLVFAGNFLYPIDGRTDPSPLPIAGLLRSDLPVGWTADSRALYMMGSGEESFRVFRVDWRSGKRELFREFGPFDATGIATSSVLVTPDGKAWVFSRIRRLSELYLVEGLK
jgi:hypothetical protein